VIGLIRSEVLKLRTTNVWWAMLLGVAALTGLALVINIFQAMALMDNPDQLGGPPGDGDVANQQQAQLNAVANSGAQIATSLYTSGQFFGLLLVMIFGVLIITNEFRHKTATATFLTTPKRLPVIGAKLVTAVFWGAIFCAVTALISIPIGAIFLAGRDVGLELSNGDVVKALLLNALAFGIWAIFGLGLGTLLKNQVLAIVIALVLFFGQFAVTTVLLILAVQFDQQWILDVQYWLPGGASQVMVSPTDLPNVPPWWAGALTLLAYGGAAAGLGTAITARRDIS
jgi:ABC-2 type transport system permease protein